jgi:S1-C subfamily serine protease
MKYLSALILVSFLVSPIGMSAQAWSVNTEEHNVFGLPKSMLQAAAGGADATVPTEIASHDLVNLTRPSVVLILMEVVGTYTFPSFYVDFDTFTVKPGTDELKHGELALEERVIEVTSEDSSGYGTGVIVSSDGVILTNAHIGSMKNDFVKGMNEYVIDHYLSDHIGRADVEKAVNKYGDEAYQKIFDLVDEYVQKNAKSELVFNLSVVKPNATGKTHEELKSESFPATIIYTNDNYEEDNRDVALLKIEATDLPALPLVDGTNVSTGKKVYIFGFPGSGAAGESDVNEPSLSQGLISGIKNDKGTTIYQTDAKVSSGSSGGPLLDTFGNLIGIISYINDSGYFGDSFGFGIPATVAQEVLTAQGITPTPGPYFTHFTTGMELLALKQCKKAIAEFNLAREVHPDFDVTAETQPYIDKCTELIASGQSRDSVWDEITSIVKNNTALTIAIGVGILLLIIVIVLLFILLRRTKRAHNELKGAHTELQAAVVAQGPGIPVAPSLAPQPAPAPVAMPQPAPVTPPPVIAQEPPAIPVVQPLPTLPHEPIMQGPPVVPVTPPVNPAEGASIPPTQMGQ